MNSNKISNTGMLKIASRWLKLLRAGNLSPKSLSRIRVHAANSAKPYASDNIASEVFSINNNPVFFNDVVNSLNTRRPKLLRDIRKDYRTANNNPVTSTADRKKLVDDIYTRSKFPTKYENPNARPNFPNTHFIAPTRNVLKGSFSQDPSSYSPLHRKINIAAGLPADFRHQAARHEIGHGFHDLAPETFRPYVVQQTNRLISQNPGLLKQLGGVSTLRKDLMKENVAHLIASRGNSRSAQQFINRTIDYGRMKYLPHELTHRYPAQPLGLDNLIDYSLKQDPSGRSAASLIQLHRNYGLPVPLKYQYADIDPSMFNLNPYLP